MTAAPASRAITVFEVLLRRKAVDQAVADLRLDGLTPLMQRLLFEKFVQGELTEEQLVDAVLV